MSALPTPEAWVAFNRASMAAEVALLRDRLRARLAGDAPSAAVESRTDTVDGRPPALDALTQRFRLSRAERGIVVLCAAAELDPAIGGLCARVGGPTAAPYPTLGLALELLAEADWPAVAPVSALRRWQLVQLSDGPEPLLARRIALDERILHYLMGVSYLDPRIEEATAPLAAAGEPLPAQREAALRIRRLWADAGTGDRLPIIQLEGDPPVARSVAVLAAAQSGLRVLRIEAAQLHDRGADNAAWFRLCEREAVLAGLALLFDLGSEPGQQTALRGILEKIEVPVFALSAEPLTQLSRRVVRISLERPDAAERHAVWQAALGARAGRLNGALHRLARQFDLDADGIRRACDLALAGGDPEEPLEQRLWAACATTSGPGLERLAERIRPVAGWEDIALPAPLLRSLREMTAHVRHAHRVHDEWQFDAASERSRGVTALFAGPSGTGKTLAAEVVAKALRLDLYRIDLSRVVSKYIGETEKNLSEVFTKAERGGAILLFDEADALFGRRSEVKDSHDRYANVEVSYLLQRMEAYRGLAILTTNMRAALDPAFLRRLRFVLQFPMPDAVHRAAIWSRLLERGMPTEGLRIERLARLSVSGGNIRSIALNAAFLAADAGEPVRMTHLLRAAQQEAAKLERNFGDAEIGGWV